MHGFRRVMIFCILTTVLPTVLLVLPLYLRHNVYADVTYAVTESDILEINDGVSSVFCSSHSLKMNETFNAFQVSRRPETTSYRKHIRLKKSMTLPDDTLEYWGFYLLKGATVALSVCSRFDGASILVVKGERNLRTCGMLDHNKNKALVTGIYLPEANQQVKITFESNAQEINSQEATRESNTLETLSTKSFNTEKLPSVTDDGFISNKTRINSTMTEDSLQSNTKILKQKQPSNQDSLTKMRHTHHKRLKKRHHGQMQYNVPKKPSLYNSVERNMKTNEYPELPKESRLKADNETEKQINLLKAELYLNKPDTAEEETDANEEGVSNGNIKRRHKRNQEPVDPSKLLDQGIRHGGNAGKNVIELEEDSSISSFENGLLSCYGGQVLLSQEFNASEHCLNVTYLVNGKHMQTRHEVIEPGYYYYIFYSDNDHVSNDIHAVFDIYKPTLQYENVTQACINETECAFSLPMMTSDRVIVEVPTKDGIDHEIDDISLLVSTCHPRMGIYIIFPIAVLFLILGCAFV